MTIKERIQLVEEQVKSVSDQLGSRLIDIDKIIKYHSTRTRNAYLIQPNDWGIKTDASSAADTTEGFNKALQWAALEGYDEIVVGPGKYLIDGVGSGKDPSVGGVSIPSNIKLTLHSRADFIVETNSSYGYSCFYLGESRNVIITGGRIIGDRYSHDFTGHSIDEKKTHDGDSEYTSMVGRIL